MITHIKKTEEYKELHHKGNAYKSHYFICIVMPIQDQELRFGITISRKVGNAVKRNKLKRQIKHIMGNIPNPTQFGGIKVNFIAKKYISEIEYGLLSNDISAILNKISKRIASNT